MSVYFSKHCLNGYRDHTGAVDPAIRDRLLSAINELTLLGPGLPRHKNLSTRMQPQTSRSRSARDATRPRMGSERAVPTEQADQVKIRRSLINHQDTFSSLLATHGVLKEKIKQKTSTVSLSAVEKGNVKVFAKVLHQEMEYKTIEITSLTTSEELANTVLKEYDAHTKDPNLFYLAMETGIKSKDSGLPISKMIVLENDARPLELQACQPQGQTKFHLKMKSGGLVRVRTNILNPGSTFKTVFIARCTTAQELIKLIINVCKSDETPENFMLREGSTDFQVDRILAHDEYPLEVQSKWKPEQERSFFLSRINKTHDTIAAQTIEIGTSDELKNEIEQQNQTIDTLNETIRKLQQEQCLEIDAQNGLRSSQNDFSRRTTSSVDSGCIKEDYDQIDDINMKPFKGQQDRDNEDDNDDDDDDVGMNYDPASFDKMRQRMVSIDALDLPMKEPICEKGESKSSQIGKLRRSFYQFQKHSMDALDLCDVNKDARKPIHSRTASQIEKFRVKFLEYYNVKVDGPQRRVSSVLTPPTPRTDTNVAHKETLERSFSTSDADTTKIDPQFHCEIQTVYSKECSGNNSCDREIERTFESSNTAREFVGDNFARAKPTFLTFFDILDEMKLVVVTLVREPGKELGLELAHVTQTGSHVTDADDDANEVVYVFHKGDGQTVVESPTEHNDVRRESSTRAFTAIMEEKSSISQYSVEEEIFSTANLDDHACFSPHIEKNAMRLNHIKSQDKKTSDGSFANHEIRNSCTSTNLGSCCAFSQWREGLEPKPRYGVRIVGIANGSIAEETGKLDRDDVIVEVNGRNVLNSSLDVVIATLKERETVHLVVAREQETLDSKENTSPLPSYHEDMKALTDQVQQLVSKVTELQDSLTKKDKTIASLKKSLIKKKLRISSKEKIVEGVQVIV